MIHIKLEDDAIKIDNEGKNLYYVPFKVSYNKLVKEIGRIIVAELGLKVQE